MLTDWRILTFLAILSWGVWGFLSKVLCGRLSWTISLAMLGIATVLVAFLSEPASLLPGWNRGTLAGFASGLFCALGYLFFYKALIQGEASTVVPVSALYIVVSAALAMAFLGEPVTFKKALGILSAVSAILLLS